MDAKRVWIIYINIVLLVFLILSMFFFLRTAPVIEEVRFAPPGAAPPFLVDVSTDFTDYVQGDDITFTADFDDGTLTTTLFIDDDTDFSDCGFTDSSDCLVFGEIVSGESLVLEASQTLTWYAQVCNSLGCDNNYEGENSRLLPDSSTNEVWADKWHLDVGLLSECYDQDPTLDDSKFYCEIQEDYPTTDCMQYLTYADLQGGDDDNPSYAYFASKRDCMHGALKYYFEVPENLDNVTFYWEGHFENPQTAQAIEGRLYVYNYTSGEYQFLTGSEIESLSETSYSRIIYHYEDLDDYISDNVMSFLAWNYRGVADGITHKECVSGVCTDVAGEGVDQCDSVGDCAGPVPDPKQPEDAGEIGSPLYSPPGDWYFDNISNDYVMLEVEEQGDESTGSFNVFECDDDTDCDDTLYCNGVETCVLDECQPGTQVVCNDDVDCTDDECNEDTDSCDYLANNTLCLNGLWCDGIDETCDTGLGCQIGIPEVCDDAIECSIDSCDEGVDLLDNLGSCVFDTSPCDSGTDDTGTTGSGGGGGGGSRAECFDSLDNDGDGLVDLDDPGCENFEDDDEYNVVIGCEDYCSLGERRCVDDGSYMICMNRDRDVCLEWSHVFVCPSSTTCDSGSCENLVRVNITGNETVVERPAVDEKSSWLVLVMAVVLLLAAIVGLFFFERREKKVVKKIRKRHYKAGKRKKRKKRKK